MRLLLSSPGTFNLIPSRVRDPSLHWLALTECHPLRSKALAHHPERKWRDTSNNPCLQDPKVYNRSLLSVGPPHSEQYSYCHHGSFSSYADSKRRFLFSPDATKLALIKSGNAFAKVPRWSLTNVIFTPWEPSQICEAWPSLVLLSRVSQRWQLTDPLVLMRGGAAPSVLPQAMYVAPWYQSLTSRRQISSISCRNDKAHLSTIFPYLECTIGFL